VHVRISSPPVTWPCFYGIDFASRAELIANGLSTDEVCRSIGADSLGYVSLDGLVAATTVPMGRLCRACFDGEYPVELPAAAHLGKHVLEQGELPIGPAAIASRLGDPTDGLAALVGGAGAADALTRP
jgi:amidophosphoribosyltransferase